MLHDYTIHDYMTIQWIIVHIITMTYVHNDMQNVLNDLRNTAHWIVINKSLNETAKSNI